MLQACQAEAPRPQAPPRPACAGRRRWARDRTRRCRRCAVASCARAHGDRLVQIGGIADRQIEVGGDAPGRALQNREALVACRDHHHHTLLPQPAQLCTAACGRSRRRSGRTDHRDARFTPCTTRRPALSLVSAMWSSALMMNLSCPLPSSRSTLWPHSAAAAPCRRIAPRRPSASRSSPSGTRRRHSSNVRAVTAAVEPGAAPVRAHLAELGAVELPSDVAVPAEVRVIAVDSGVEHRPHDSVTVGAVRTLRRPRPHRVDRLMDQRPLGRVGPQPRDTDLGHPRAQGLDLVAGEVGGDEAPGRIDAASARSSPVFAAAGRSPRSPACGRRRSPPARATPTKRAGSAPGGVARRRRRARCAAACR